MDSGIFSLFISVDEDTVGCATNSGKGFLTQILHSTMYYLAWHLPNSITLLNTNPKAVNLYNVSKMNGGVHSKRCGFYILLAAQARLETQRESPNYRLARAAI